MGIGDCDCDCELRGQAESEGEGREVGAGGLAAGARDGGTKRKEDEAQEHPGGEEGPVERRAARP